VPPLAPAPGRSRAVCASRLGGGAFSMRGSARHKKKTRSMTDTARHGQERSLWRLRGAAAAQWPERREAAKHDALQGRCSLPCHVDALLREDGTRRAPRAALGGCCARRWRCVLPVLLCAGRRGPAGTRARALSRRRAGGRCRTAGRPWPAARAGGGGCGCVDQCEPAGPRAAGTWQGVGRAVLSQPHASARYVRLRARAAKRMHMRA